MTPWAHHLVEMRGLWEARSAKVRQVCPFRVAPHWAREHPHLVRPRGQWPGFQEQAALVLGLCFMANGSLYEAQSIPAPGRWVWSPDPDVDAHPELLGDIGRWFWTFRDGAAAPPGLRAFAAAACNDHLHPDARPVPHLITRGRLCFESSVLVDPVQLPHRRLGPPFLPLLVVREGPAAGVCPLPLAFFPKALVAQW